jgi:predicted deacylase
MPRAFAEPQRTPTAVHDEAPAVSPRGRVDVGQALALQAACGNRAFAQIVAARIQRSPQPDDPWVAERVAAGQLGTSAKKRPIEVFYFPGRTARRALVIAGVHGSERQGIEVANLLKADLLKTPPAFSVILVPSLFPDNAATGPFGIREGGTPTNRDFPTPDKDFAASGGVDAKGRKILVENEMLMHLMEHFRPERVISLHGTQAPGQAGVFYDPRELTAAERAQVEHEAAHGAAAATHPRVSDGPEDQEARQRALYEAGLQHGLTAKRGAVRSVDEELSLKAAKQIDAATSGVAGRDTRDVTREDESSVSADQAKARRKHGSVSGNVGASGDVNTAFWAGSVPGGVSLGGYAAARGMSVFTVEPPVNRNIGDYGKGGNTDGDKVSQAGRIVELQAYADAVRTVLLGD